MIINRVELEKALTIVKPGLAAKELIEQTTSFAFTTTGVTTYNDEIALSCPIENLELEGAIKAEELYGFLKKVKKDEIDITITKNEIQFSSGRIKVGFALQQEISLPLESLKKKSKWSPIPDDFCHYLSLAMGAAGTDMSRAKLTCINITQEGNMTGSDGYKIMHCETGQEMPIKTFLLPATSAREVIKLNPTHIAEGKGWVHFQSKDKAVLSCRIFEDDMYPEVDKIISVEGVELTFPKTFDEVLDRASVFSKRGYMLDESVAITIENNRLIIKAKSDTGWINETINIRYNKEALIFSFTPFLLKDILKETHTFIVGEKALRFEGAGWIYVAILRNLE